jgi:hypothetical protein
MFIIAVISFAMMVWGGYQTYKISKYEFENRSEGGVVGFKSFNSAIGHRVKRSLFVSMFMIGLIIFMIDLIIWFHVQ